MGEWLQEYWEQSQIPGSGVHWGALMQPLSYYQDDLCGVYLMVHSSDAVALDLADNYTVQLDIRRGDEWSEHYIMPTIGEGIWVDGDPPYDQEWVEWSDPNFNGGRFPEDNHWQMEEYLIPIDMTPLLQDPRVDEVRVRIHDQRHNWRRTENVLGDCGGSESEGLGGLMELDGGGSSYEIVDLMFRGDRYPNASDSCYFGSGGAGNPPDRRTGCDGYVRPRVNGNTPLDLCALVKSMPCQLPPPYVQIFIQAPMDQPLGDQMMVYLYELDRQDPQWEEIWADFECANSSLDEECQRIYCRGSNRSFVGISGDRPMIEARDNRPENPPDPPGPLSEEIPILWVTSHETGDSDFKDYSVAVARHPDFHSTWMQSMVSLCHYGWGNRGLYDDEVCDLNEKQDNYRDNVLTFGQEFIRAEYQGHYASFPVESEADILFVFAHSGFSHALGVTSVVLVPFRHSPYDPYPYPWPPSSAWTSQNFQDWAVMPRLWNGGVFDVGRDADWIAVFGCASVGTGETNASWRLIMGPDDVKAVMGFRDILFPLLGDPSMPSYGYWYFEHFINDFCANLESNEYPGNSGLWDQGLMSSDKGIRCWMEAALTSYEYLLGIRKEHSDWKELRPQEILSAAAIEPLYYTYIIADEDGDGVYKIYRKDW